MAKDNFMDTVEVQMIKFPEGSPQYFPSILRGGKMSRTVLLLDNRIVVAWEYRNKRPTLAWVDRMTWYSTLRDGKWIVMWKTRIRRVIYNKIIKKYEKVSELLPGVR